MERANTETFLKSVIIPRTFRFVVLTIWNVYSAHCIFPPLRMVLIQGRGLREPSWALPLCDPSLPGCAHWQLIQIYLIRVLLGKF